MPALVAGDAWSRRLSAFSIDDGTNEARRNGGRKLLAMESRVGRRGGGLKRGHPTRRGSHGLAPRPPQEVDYDRILPGLHARRLGWLHSVVRIDQVQRKDDEGAGLQVKRGAGRPALVVN